MKYVIIVLLVTSCLNFSCYTAGYTVVSSVRIPNAYFSKEALVIPIMEKFKNEHIELMIDSNVAKKYFPNYYSSAQSEQQILNCKKLYPFYPEINWAGLHSWTILTPDKTTIYELGLYADGFAISYFFIFNNETTTSYGGYKLADMKKEGKALKKTIFR